MSAPRPFPLESVGAFVLRPAKSSDESFCWQLHRETFRDYVRATWGWNEATHEAGFRQQLRERFAYHQIVSDAHQDIGIICIERYASHIFLDYIAILGSHARRGAGTCLITKLQDMAASVRMPVRLSVLKVNPARALYERLGFIVSGCDAHRTFMKWSAGDEE